MNCAFPGDKGERESNLDQGTCSMCSGSSIKSFVSSDLQFSRKSWYLMSRNWCIDVQNGYKTILERSSNLLVRFWKLRQPQDHSNLGLIDDCTCFPFSCKFKQTNNIQSDHQHQVHWERDIQSRHATKCMPRELVVLQIHRVCRGQQSLSHNPTTTWKNSHRRGNSNKKKHNAQQKKRSL